MPALHALEPVEKLLYRGARPQVLEQGDGIAVPSAGRYSIVPLSRDRPVAEPVKVPTRLSRQAVAGATRSPSVSVIH